MVNGYENTNWKAGATDEGSSPASAQLFTAEDEIKTAPVIVLTGQDLAFGTIVEMDAAGKVIPWAGVEQPVGIIATAINTIDPVGDRHAEIYEGGCFNPALLIWPAALDTYAERNSALRKGGAPFRVKRLL